MANLGITREVMREEIQGILNRIEEVDFFLRPTYPDLPRPLLMRGETFGVELSGVAEGADRFKLNVRIFVVNGKIPVTTWEMTEGLSISVITPERTAVGVIAKDGFYMGFTLSGITLDDWPLRLELDPLPLDG